MQYTYHDASIVIMVSPPATIDHSTQPATIDGIQSKSALVATSAIKPMIRAQENLIVQLTGDLSKNQLEVWPIYIVKLYRR